MRFTAIRAIAIAAVLAGTLGCQSAPRWAWWKRDQPPEDRSLLARSAAAPLPSAQSTPQAVAVEGLTPAASPSSTNLAAAGAASVPPLELPATSAATLAAAPPAKYPPSTVWPGGTAPSTSAAAAGTTAAGGSALPPVAAATPPTGPYDPSGYRPGAGMAASTTSTMDRLGDIDRYGTSSADRYAMQPDNSGGTNVGNGFDHYSASPSQSPIANAATSNLLGQASDDRYALPRTPSQPPFPNATDNKAVAAAGVPNSAAALPLKSSPGQYRPGGTSSYSANSATEHIEMAARPSPPTSAPTPPPMPNAPLPPPTSNNSPWAPAPTAPNFGSGTWTY